MKLANVIKLHAGFCSGFLIHFLWSLWRFSIPSFPLFPLSLSIELNPLGTCLHCCGSGALKITSFRRSRDACLVFEIRLKSRYYCQSCFNRMPNESFNIVNVRPNNRDLQNEITYCPTQPWLGTRRCVPKKQTCFSLQSLRSFSGLHAKWRLYEVEESRRPTIPRVLKESGTW